MVETVETFDGWYALHDFRTIDWEKWQQASEAQRKSVLDEFHSLASDWKTITNEKQGDQALFSIVGQKADLMFMTLRPTMKDLNKFENKFNKTALAHYMKPAYSYVSIIEKSSYTKPQTDPYEDPAMLSKLFPKIPETEYMCFYPMSKLRGETNNWFTLPKEERGRMMLDHIKTAKPFTEDVKRIITGSIGLDDYEWGVTLFCDDPLQFKKLIYDTRFDEVSAKYGIFGSFYIGNQLPFREVDEYFSV
ncbi:heme-dependent peroxidase [Virgibacillus profundi]|uniref:Coproheme decarboxylase n=1 Tax=Virgibacillus profundi TaxID=2024555 RepID=A0A2A2ICQ8_9BACI|nr:hydrogen peroxide-dependent heme synthase [Virgibacillus profundi]PAV29158.1 heme-dependent peroxidase [Virgibacillus profundi]PXY53327.1 heme-dependent peroxidase [Virgibacillus profundi]